MPWKTVRARLACAALLLILSGSISYARFMPAPERDRGNAIATPTSRGDVVKQTHLYCLALAVYFEGGSTGESEEGQRHIARVVTARARADRPQWGGSDICDVVFYKRSKTCQFSFTCLPLARRTPREGEAWDMSMWIAMEELAGESDVEAKLIRYYMNAELSNPEYACRFRKEFVRVTAAGRHEFFREATSEERKELAEAEHEDCKRHKRVLAAEKEKSRKRAAKSRAKREAAKAAKTKSAKKKTNTRAAEAKTRRTRIE